MRVMVLTDLGNSPRRRGAFSLARLGLGLGPGLGPGLGLGLAREFSKETR